MADTYTHGLTEPLTRNEALPAHATVTAQTFSSPVGMTTRLATVKFLLKLTGMASTMVLMFLGTVRVARHLNKDDNRNLALWVLALSLPVISMVILVISILETLCVRYVWHRLLDRGLIMDLESQPIWKVPMFYYLIIVGIGLSYAEYEVDEEVSPTLSMAFRVMQLLVLYHQFVYCAEDHLPSVNVFLQGGERVHVKWGELAHDVEHSKELLASARWISEDRVSLELVKQGGSSHINFDALTVVDPAPPEQRLGYLRRCTWALSTIVFGRGELPTAEDIRFRARFRLLLAFGLFVCLLVEIYGVVRCIDFYKHN